MWRGGRALSGFPATTQRQVINAGRLRSNAGLQHNKDAHKMPRAITAIVTATVLLAGCIFLPQTSSVYNAECEIYERKMTLEAHQVGALGGCHNEGCVALLVVAGVVSATTAVVSGSVVVVGNVVYWLEEKGQCMNRKPVRQQVPASNGTD